MKTAPTHRSLCIQFCPAGPRYVQRNARERLAGTEDGRHPPCVSVASLIVTDILKAEDLDAAQLH